MGIFTLEARHLECGITDEDFSSYAGYPVHSFMIDQFPHYTKLKRGIVLPEKESQERAQAIYGELQRCRATPDHGGLFDFESVKGLVNVASATARISFRRPTKTEGPERLIAGMEVYRHFALLREKGVDGVINAESVHHYIPVAGFGNSRIFPGLLNENTNIKDFQLGEAALIMRNKGGTFYEAQLTGLLSDLHEMRHLPQIWMLPDHDYIARSYLELDADLFARSIFREKGIGQSVLCADLHKRYFDMLNPSTSPVYWFAPALEAFEAGKPPPNYPKTFWAVMQIKLAVMNAIELSGDDLDLVQKANRAWDQRHTLYNWQSWHRNSHPIEDAYERFVPQPDSLSDCLNTLLTGDQLANPLATHIAYRWREANDYFSACSESVRPDSNRDPTFPAAHA